MTSVYPLCTCAHIKSEVIILAAKEYTNASEAMRDKCMHDTHSGTRECDRHTPSEVKDALKDFFTGNRRIPFDCYATKVGNHGTTVEANQWCPSAYCFGVKAGHYVFEGHHINECICSSGAMCFSHMRADIGIDKQANPFLFEIAEFPGLYGFDDAYNTTTRDLFRMIGLDHEPLPTERRAEFENNHLGGWKLLET